MRHTCFRNETEVPGNTSLTSKKDTDVSNKLCSQMKTHFANSSALSAHKLELLLILSFSTNFTISSESTKTVLDLLMNLN